LPSAVRASSRPLIFSSFFLYDRMRLCRKLRYGWSTVARLLALSSSSALTAAFLLFLPFLPLAGALAAATGEAAAAAEEDGEGEGEAASAALASTLRASTLAVASDIRSWVYCRR
jgi:hypothetical protein